MTMICEENTTVFFAEYKAKSTGFCNILLAVSGEIQNVHFAVHGWTVLQQGAVP